MTGVETAPVTQPDADVRAPAPRRPLVYLASPYSHPDPVVREARYCAVVEAAARILRAGRVWVYAPIVHSHPLCLAGDLGLGWIAWEDFDRRLIAVADEMWVLTLDGWTASEGIHHELLSAREHSLRTWTIEPGSPEPNGLLFSSSSFGAQS